MGGRGEGGDCQQCQNRMIKDTAQLPFNSCLLQAVRLACYD